MILRSPRSYIGWKLGIVVNEVGWEGRTEGGGEGGRGQGGRGGREGGGQVVEGEGEGEGKIRQ